MAPAALVGMEALAGTAAELEGMVELVELVALEGMVALVAESAAELALPYIFPYHINIQSCTSLLASRILLFAYQNY
ncbi:hypothetical protein HYD_3510 [Candidatus Hydrogenosomobacter endosymbioticus]|uniref:Uncharacterized protein n=1 Tax=Candidatus Hydrogenosomobacter endosymbioticus TaxID=2558174 RepID=A0ABN6L300_9PROT|nr:hypothetical protein HYD_3510 [Candidatus Hydrogenosomobacter endosymbioticus]